MTDPAADELRALAAEVARLAPDWQQPERYYEHRSDLAARLRRLARAAEGMQGLCGNVPGVHSRSLHSRLDKSYGQNAPLSAAKAAADSPDAASRKGQTCS